MKTINNKQCNSSTGRIALVIKGLWANYHKNTLWAWAWVIFGLTIFPRVDYIFNLNVDSLLISEWSRSDVFQRSLIIPFAMIIGIPLLFNKFVRNSKPITFASIPANLWEKIVGLIAYTLFIVLGAFAVTYLTVVIDYLLAPNIVPLGMSEFSKEVFEQIFINSSHIRNFIVASLLVASGLLTLIYTSVYFKKLIQGLGAGIALWITGVLLFVSIAVNNASLEHFLTDIGQHYVALLIGTALTLIDIALLVLIIRKLKRIEN